MGTHPLRGVHSLHKDELLRLTTEVLGYNKALEVLNNKF